MKTECSHHEKPRTACQYYNCVREVSICIPDEITSTTSAIIEFLIFASSSCRISPQFINLSYRSHEKSVTNIKKTVQ